ncbi:MAG: flagellar hook protein FlgE [Gammaproteobacteria bacterium]|nr:flagellar hook protein FlgE [Gammaproteobacteria bacterium]
MSFRTALSGLNAAQTDLNVTGNNIANANTTGFKSSRTEFVDVYAASFLGVSAATAGSGVRVSSIAQDFSQGNIAISANNLDMAINGDGFFVLNDSGNDVYSRAGNFHVDRDGYVVNSQDAKLQVYPASTAGNYDTGVLTDLKLLTAEGVPSATTTLQVGINLPASASEPAMPFAANNPDTFNASSSTVIYDSLGSSHTSTLYFRKDETTPPGVNLWNAYLYTDGTLVTSGGASPTQLSFNPDGTLATAQPIAFDNYTPTNGANAISQDVNFTSTTQFGSPFSVNTLSQDGFSTGRLSGIAIDSDGVVSARYTNGQSTTLGKVAMATFANNNGLNQLGNTNWGQTYTSGDRILGQAGRGTFGLLQSGAVESSNVDVAEQLIGLITAQRNYQANAQVISTENQVSQTIINIR